MVELLRNKDDLKEVYNNWKTIFAANDRGSINYFFERSLSLYKIYFVKENDIIVSSLASKISRVRLNKERLNVFYSKNYFTLINYQDYLSKYELFDYISELSDHQCLINLTADQNDIYQDYNYEVVDIRKTYKVNKSDLLPVEMEHVTDIFNPQELYQTMVDFYSTFDFYMDYSYDEFYNYLKQLKHLDKKILVSKVGYEITGYAIYQHDHNLVVEELVYFTGKTLFTLLKAVAEETEKEHFFITVSENEALAKILPTAQIVEEKKVSIRINDIDLFNRLYGTDYQSTASFVKKKRYKTNIVIRD